MNTYWCKQPFLALCLQRPAKNQCFAGPSPCFWRKDKRYVSPPLTETSWKGQIWWFYRPLEEWDKPQQWNILDFCQKPFSLFSCRPTWWQRLSRVWATWPSGWRVWRWRRSRRSEQLLPSSSAFVFGMFSHCMSTRGRPSPALSQDSELNELRKTIELLKKQNAVAQAAINGVINTPELAPKGDRTG